MGHGASTTGRRRTVASGNSTYKRREGIKDSILSDISEKLGDEWKKLAILLGFDEAKIRTLEVNNPGNVHNQKFQMLTEWKRRQEPSTKGQIGVLCSALKKINRHDIVTWLQQGIKDSILSDISKKLGDEWKKLAIHLGFDEAKIRTFEVNNPGNVHNQKFQMLTEWKRRQEPSTKGQIGVLCSALKKINRHDIVTWLQQRTGLARFTPMENRQQQLYKVTTVSSPVNSLKPSRTVATGGLGHLALTQGLKVGIENPIFSDISEKLGDEWKKLAIHLGFDEANIRTFEVNNPRDVHHQRFQMLTEWRRRQPSTEGQMDVLCRALEKINRNDIVVWLQGRPVISGPTPLEYCQQRLSEHYKDTTSTIPVHPADPSRTVAMGQFYSDLELTRGVTGKQTSQEPIRLRGETRILDQVRTVALDSWDDMLNTDIVGSLKIILSGGAGFGKSTLLLRVANASIDPKAIMAKFKLVFLVLLKKMQQSSCVLKAIWDQIFPKNTQLRKADLKKIIDDNEAETLILLDGLDEIPSSVLHSPAKEGEYGVNDILENRVLVKSCVIVTTRPHMIDYALEKYPHFARVQTHGFTLNTANKYIAEYFAEKVSLGDELKSNLKSNESLQTLTQIPILLLLMCIVWENLSKMPDRLTELYTQFAKVVVSQRCYKGEDQSELMKSMLPRLGRVALNGLLDPKGERLMFSSEEFDKKDLEEGCRLGFLRQDTSTSGSTKMNLVTFLHKSFQEFSAAYFLASLYSLVGKRRFHDELKRINADNVLAMRDLLRFTCGISSESPATGLILDHVQKQKSREFENKEEIQLQDLARVLLFESSSSKWADKLERPTELSGENDLKALHYYLQCVPRPPVKIEEFTVHCRSYDNLTIWRDILLSGKIRPTNDDPPPSWSCVYTMADRGSDAMQTLEETLQGVPDQRIRERLELSLKIEKSSCFDDECVLGHLPCVSNQVTNFYIRDRSCTNDVSRLTNALQECSRLQSAMFHDTNLHNNVQCLASLISPSLTWLALEACGLDDDDIPDLIRIIPARHGCLTIFDVTGNAFSVDGLEKLCVHLHSLPNLLTFHVGYTGPNKESFESMAWHCLRKFLVV